MRRRLQLDIVAGVVGFSAIITQTVLLREFLAVCGGNELIVGIVLANWMILTALGAYSARFIPVGRTSLQLFLALLLPLSLLPFATIILIEPIRNIFFVPGAMPGPGASTLVSFFTMMPYCLFSGILFAICAKALTEDEPGTGGSRTFMSEALGSVAGGVLLNLAILPYCSAMQALILTAAAVSLIVLVVGFMNRIAVLHVAAALLLAICVGIIAGTDIDSAMESRRYPKQQLIIHRDTPYGSITVTGQREQMNIYENGMLVRSTNDRVSDEEAVHYAMIQHPHPRNVLMVSGGTTGIPEEILKYGVESIDYVEADPWVIGIWKTNVGEADDERMHIVAMDVRRFVRETQTRYDVVLINAPDPSTARDNRTYTHEFFDELKRCMTAGGVVSVGLHTAADYAGPEALDVYSTIARTLRSSFARLIVIPGSRYYFIASDSALTTSVAERIAVRGIATGYVNRDYIDDEANRERGNSLLARLDPAAAMNTDFSPVAYYRQLLYWMSSMNASLWIPVALMLVVALVVLIRASSIGIGIFSAGFAGSGMEVLILLSVQILCGIMYQAAGFIITIFMGGLALGVRLARGIHPGRSRKYFSRIMYSTAVLALAAPFLLMLIRNFQLGPIPIYCILSMLTLCIGILVGAGYPVALQIARSTTGGDASLYFSLDLLGSALGAFCVAVIFIPLLGISTTFFGLSAVMVAAGVMVSGVRGKSLMENESDG